MIGKKEVKIWDAGCAMGQEPLSLAILLAENMGQFAFKNLKIYATDIDKSDQFEDIIAAGVYPAEQLKRIPKELLEKYFTYNEEDNNYKIVPFVHNRIKFYKHDLLSLQSINTEFSLILCKNVLLHFKKSERIEVINMFYQSLSEGGFLAMEQTQKLPGKTGELFKKVTGNGQLFRKKELVLQS